MNNDQEDDPIGSEEEPKESRPPLSRRITAGGVAVAFGAGSLVHGAPCVAKSVYEATMCESGFTTRHFPHTETGGNTSSTGSGVLIVALGTATATDAAPPPGWTFTRRGS